MNAYSYIYDWKEPKDIKKIIDAFGELGTTCIVS